MMADAPTSRSHGPPRHPVLAPLNWVIDQVVARVAGRPATIRWDASPLELVRGRARLLTVGVTELRIAGLTVDRGVVRIEQVRLVGGLEPRLQGGPVTARLTVVQEHVDEWLGRAGLPFRLELTDEGILSSTGVGSLRMGRVLTELAVREDGTLRLRPVRAVGRTLPKGLGEVLTGSLPLPGLPTDAQLVDVEHRAGRLSLTLALDDLDEALDLGAPDRLRARLDLLERSDAK
jgi:LmeA-like phospholipid-binding